MSHDVNTLFEQIYRAYPKPFSFNPEKDLDKQRKAIREKYAELLKMPKKDFKGTAVVECEKNEDERFTEICFSVETEPDFFVPCHMLIPKTYKKGDKLPAVICLQGHATDTQQYILRKSFAEEDEAIIGDGYDLAVEAAEQGYIGVYTAIRGYGELKSEYATRIPCQQYYMRSLMVGRVAQGERIHDIMCVVDALDDFEAVDTGRIGITGNADGGVIAYSAAAMEDRIKVCMPSCAFTMYADSILDKMHCCCNYVPDFAKYMEMPDLAMLIAPRPLVVVSGAKAYGSFPLESALTAFDIVKDIYNTADASDKCQHVIGPEGGRTFYGEIAWPFFKKYI